MTDSQRKINVARTCNDAGGTPAPPATDPCASQSAYHQLKSDRATKCLHLVTVSRAGPNPALESRILAHKACTDSGIWIVPYVGEFERQPTAQA